MKWKQNRDIVRYTKVERIYYQQFQSMTKVKRCPSGKRKMTLGENLNVHKGSIKNGYYMCKYISFLNYQNLFQRSLTFSSPKQPHSSQV